MALLDADDLHHTACVAALNRLPAAPLLTTWPCFTEAMHLLGSVRGYSYQAPLWKLRSDRRLVLHDLTAAEIDQMATLMDFIRKGGEDHSLAIHPQAAERIHAYLETAGHTDATTTKLYEPLPDAKGLRN